MTNRTVLPLAAMVGAASLWTGPALADDWGITMPSGNIMCTRDPGEGGIPHLPL